MKEVTRSEFYRAIGRLNVNVTPKGAYPYRTDFCLKNGHLVGYIQDTESPDKSFYYLIEQ